MQTIESFLELIDRPNRLAIEKFLNNAGNLQKFDTAPGSRSAHHAWEGGYKEHVRQTMMIAKYQFDALYQQAVIDSLPPEERFTLSEALVVMFLHDIEKMFMYEMGEGGMVITKKEMSKLERKGFRQEVIDIFGFVVSPGMANALEHVEGVRDDQYVPGERTENPLAALCHSADLISARMMYDWKGV